MSEISAIRALSHMGEAAKHSRAVTKTGKIVDLAKGYTVKGPDGVVIPFKPETPLEKAKLWTKNFYKKDFEFIEAAKVKDAEGVPPGWGATEEYSMLRDKTDHHTYIQVADLDTAYRIQMSFIPKSKRGQGLGAGMYRALFEQAKKKGMKVQSDSRMSKESIAIWKRFKELGYPITDNSAHAKQMGDSDMYQTGKAMFEYDPGKAEAPALLKKQAGAAPGDEKIETTGALTRPQAGLKKGDVAPGIYLDDETGQYWQVGVDGQFKPLEIKDPSTASKNRTADVIGATSTVLAADSVQDDKVERTDGSDKGK